MHVTNLQVKLIGIKFFMGDTKNEIYRKMFSILSNSSYSTFMIINEFYEYYMLVMFSSFLLEKLSVKKSVNSVFLYLENKNFIRN